MSLAKRQISSIRHLWECLQQYVFFGGVSMGGGEDTLVEGIKGSL